MAKQLGQDGTRISGIPDIEIQERSWRYPIDSGLHAHMSYRAAGGTGLDCRNNDKSGTISVTLKLTWYFCPESL